MPAVRYGDAVAALKGGAVLSCALPCTTAAGDGPKYELMPCGGYVTARTFERLLPHLAPSDKGLFEEVPAQSYRWCGD